LSPSILLLVLFLAAMKVGMLSIWDTWGERHAVTVVHLDDVRVLQVKTEETEGYTGECFPIIVCIFSTYSLVYVAIQLGIGERKLKRAKGTLIGHCRKALGEDVAKRKIAEFRVSPDALLTRGQKISAAHFVPGQLVDVAGITKGKGFQGVMKRWGFRGGRASHGNSLNHRTLGSTGMRQDPGRVSHYIFGPCTMNMRSVFLKPYMSMMIGFQE
jgi:large subunit ribosomal protein L3